MIKTILSDIKGLFSNRNFLQENLDYEIYWQNKGNIKQLKANSYHIKRAKFVSLVAEPNSSLLDLGSGDGAQLKEIEKICHIEMTASDFNDVSLSRLREIGFSTKKIRLEEINIARKAYEVMDFLQLKHLANEYAGNLSGGQKKLLELGRTMMVDPKIVLLDEVGAGVNRTLLNAIGDAILRLNKEFDYTFCMIEHDIEFISKLCNPVIVMAEGSILMTDEISKVKENDKVIEVYLGKS